jgi:hypothetical protein
MAAGWPVKMAALQDRLRDLFEIENHPLTETARSAGRNADHVLTELRFVTAQNDPVRGVFCCPQDRSGPVPAVLVIHAHGNRYDIGADELMQGRPALQAPLGPALAAIGCASLCLDLPCFGQRSGVSESAAAKSALWHGRSLAGQMLGECSAAVTWLSAQPEVRPERVGVFGISMGATLGYWLAAVDPRVHVLAQQCCFADFAALIQSGAHDLHGLYLTIPGLLGTASNGAIAGLVAPRAQFIGIGDADPLTPPLAADIALAEVRAAYASCAGRLMVHREPRTGHVETPEMRHAVLGFLRQELR